MAVDEFYTPTLSDVCSLCQRCLDGLQLSSIDVG